MTYDQKTRDLVRASAYLYETEHILSRTRMAVKMLGLPEDEKVLLKMVDSLHDIGCKVDDMLMQYATEGRGKEGDE